MRAKTKADEQAAQLPDVSNELVHQLCDNVTWMSL